jgi:hypothetical protein
LKLPNELNLLIAHDLAVMVYVLYSAAPGAAKQVVEQAETPLPHLGRWSCRTMARAVGRSRVPEALHANLLVIDEPGGNGSSAI